MRPIRLLDATVTAPGSKSYTQRALVAAALARGESVLRSPLLCEDTERMMEGLARMGAGIRSEDGTILVSGVGGQISPAGTIHLGDNGTAMRFLAAVASLGKGPSLLTGSPRLCQRPMESLLDALGKLGGDARSLNQDGCPPVVVSGRGLSGGAVELGDAQSSQFLSAILLVAPFAHRDTTVRMRGRVPSLPYVEMTVEVMRAFGAEVIQEAPDRYGVKSGRHYESRVYGIEGDLSSASYFFAAAALTKGRVRVLNVRPDTRQGDAGLLPLLERFGCRVSSGDGWVEVSGGVPPRGQMMLDLGNMPDIVPTLAVLAAVRPGRTVLANIGHLRVKESDRIAALAAELARTGVKVEEGEASLVIHGTTPRGAEIETYGDHRMAMSFAVLGLRVPGMRIKDPGCVRKSFPGFWEELARLH